MFDDEVKQVEALVSAGTIEFLIKLATGTQSLLFSAVSDTRNDLTWT